MTQTMPPMTSAAAGSTPPIRLGTPIDTIEAPSSGQKGKLAFLNNHGVPCSREDAAVEFYRQRGFETLRGEVQFWQAMFGLAFWEEIFGGTGTPNAFQDIPAGLFSGAEFYRPRRRRMEQKAKLIGQSELEPFLRKQLGRHGHQWTRIVHGPPRGDLSYLDVLRAGDVAEFLRTIPSPVFAKIVHRIASNPSQNRAGLPDYMIWKDGIVTFVEVKGPREQIRDSQAEWHAWMQAEGIPITVVRVKRAA